MEWRSVGNSKRICSIHFTSDCFINPIHVEKGLKQEALPTLYPIEVLEPTNEQESENNNNNDSLVFPELELSLEEPVDVRHGTWNCPNHECKQLAKLCNAQKQRIIELEELLSRERKENKSISRQSYRRKKSMQKKNTIIKDSNLKRKLKNTYMCNDKKLLRALKKKPIMKESIENELKNKYARRYTFVRDLATIQKLSSSTTYKNLRAAGVLTLPHPRTIVRWHRRISSSPGFNMTILKQMKKRTESMHVKEKVVDVLLDGMAIKPGLNFHAASDMIHGFPDSGDTSPFEQNDTQKLATEAIVFMVRSVFTKYKQVIGYFLTNSSLGYQRQQELVCEAVLLVQNAGFHPVALVMDQHPTNVKMAESLGVSNDKPFFEIGDSQIFLFYDSPHLIKSFRNNLYAKNLLLNNKIVSFKYIKDLYQLDISKVPRLVPKLLKSSIELNTFSKMNVRIATRTLSSSAAKGISAFITLGLMPEDAQPTAELLTLMDSLFDCFNSKSKSDALKPLRGAITNSSTHWEFLDETRKILTEMVFIPASSFDPQKALEESHQTLSKSQRKPPCLNGLIQNIYALRCFWDVLSGKFAFTHLRTNHICQDPLENKFSAIRRACGNNDTPSADQFGVAIKYDFVKRNAMSAVKTNCEPDQTIDLIEKNEQDNGVDKEDEEETSEDPLANSDTFVTRPFEPLTMEPGLHMDSAELNALSYIVGFSISKLKHGSCRDSMNIHDDDDDDPKNNSLLFCKLKRLLAKSKFSLPNNKALQIGVTLHAACREKFSSFLAQNRKGLKLRLKEYIDYHDYEMMVCAVCFNEMVNRILNTLIKAEIMKISQKKKNTKSKTGKARRMGIVSKPIKSKSRKQSKTKCPLVSPEEQNDEQSVTPGPSSVISKKKDTLEKVVSSFPLRETIDIDIKDCYNMSDEQIFSTYEEFEKEICFVFNKYKLFTDRQLKHVPELVNWESAYGIMNEDQLYKMIQFLAKRVVPEHEKGMYEDIIVIVLVYEWAVRIFIKHHQFDDRKTALQHLQRQGTIIFSEMLSKSA